MEKIEFEGEVYYVNKNVFYDSSFMQVSKEISDKLAAHYLKNKDVSKLNKEQLLEYIKSIKNMEEHALCINTINDGLKIYKDTSFVKDVLPILTSCYRAIGRPRDAISIAKQYLKDYLCDSVALFTSMAAAFCDVGEYEEAKKYAGIAYAQQGGGVGYQNELSLVYARIHKACKE
ncbi:MAG: hypothetical protein ACI4MQ_02305 [Candidatus Coproplasma sp.]